MNDTTKRFHRDMNSAFGPHCNKHITEPDRPMDWQDRAVLLACIVIAVAFGIAWGLT